MIEVAISHILKLDVWFFEQLVLDAIGIVSL